MTAPEGRQPTMGERVIQALQDHLSSSDDEGVQGMITGFVGLVTSQHLDGTTSWWIIGPPDQDDFRSDELAGRLRTYTHIRTKMIMQALITAETQGDDDE